MDSLSTPGTLRAWVARERARGHRIALVPTMGALHEGHLALVDAARRVADRVVMSIFVNPLQFRPGEDFEKYPRDLARDSAMAEARQVDALFTPSVAAMYPAAQEIRVVAGDTASRWEGAVRPGHFDGVLTVVAKLFNLVQPDVACFGQKDIQQVTLIRAMVRELDFPVAIHVVPTVREPDGLALSSRNIYLGPAERIEALALSRGLRAAEALWLGGERNPERVREAVATVLAGNPGIVADYIAVVDPVHLAPVAQADAGTIVAVAARVGATRLIDNLILGAGGW